MGPALSQESGTSEEDQRQAFIAQGIPAGLESADEGSVTLDELPPKYEALSASKDFLSPLSAMALEDEELPEWSLWTHSTRSPSSYLSEKIAMDKASRIDKRDKERADGPAPHDPTLFCHKVATIYVALADVVESLASQTGSSKARALSHAPTQSSAQVDAPLLPISSSDQRTSLSP